MDNGTLLLNNTSYSGNGGTLVVNGISYSGGTSEGGTDVSDTTAIESDVLLGKIFHKANGDRAVGTLVETKALLHEVDSMPTNLDYVIECGFRPKKVLIDIGLDAEGISNVIYKLSAVIDADGYWTDFHTGSTGSVSYLSRRTSEQGANSMNWEITDTSFIIKSASTNWNARKWRFAIFG